MSRFGFAVAAGSREPLGFFCLAQFCLGRATVRNLELNSTKQSGVFAALTILFFFLFPRLKITRRWQHNCQWACSGPAGDWFDPTQQSNYGLFSGLDPHCVLLSGSLLNNFLERQMFGPLNRSNDDTKDNVPGQRAESKKECRRDRIKNPASKKRRVCLILPFKISVYKRIWSRRDGSFGILESFRCIIWWEWQYGIFMFCHQSHRTKRCMNTQKKEEG